MSWSSVRRFPWVNLALFLATVASTLLAGAAMAGVQSLDVKEICLAGWTFAIPLIIALGTHEMGHFIVARRHGLFPSWPYFIPAPTIVGTFGAVIRMKYDHPPTREQLFDVGIAGPLAGFVVSLLFLVVGAALSTVDPKAADLQTFTLADGFLNWFHGGGTAIFAKALNGPYLVLGDSLLVKSVVYVVRGAPSALVSLHPIGFAGWVGLFVTTLNLLPIGQLDGGHVAYALLGKRFRFMPYFVLPALFILGVFGWPGWLVWAILIGFLGFRHPPAGGEPLGKGRMALAWLCLVIFVLIFTPSPIQPAW
jgi:membrane-associated protease RseP (regulator of RpoE activity)